MGVRSVAWIFLLAIVLVPGVEAQQLQRGEPAAPSASVTIHLIDYARIRPQLIAHARAFVARVYGAIGVSIRWADTIDAMRAPAAAEPIIDPRDIVVIILNPGMTERANTSSTTVGIAATTPEGSSRIA